MTNSKKIAAVTLALLAGTAGLLVAGPLNPAAGPVAATYKTLGEVEPRIAINATNTPGDADSVFKITQPGSYYMTANVYGVAGKNGIEIVASGVTIDLTGFDLLGTAGSLDGIRVTASNVTSVTVINGSVRSWGGEGVNLGSLGAAGCRVEGVLAARNAGNGISTGDGCTIAKCTAYLNTGNGISPRSNCTVSDCSATANGGRGLSPLTGCVITRCTANSNSSHGIEVGNGCSVIDCVVRMNSLDGINCPASCTIRGNTCVQNGAGGDGAGIHATLTDNRIEDNNCDLADRGVDVDSAGNFIIRNSCSGNTTNWVIAVNNYYGPIVDRTGVATAAVNGPAAAGTLGSADANANFSY